MILSRSVKRFWFPLSGAWLFSGFFLFGTVAAAQAPRVQDFRYIAINKEAWDKVMSTLDGNDSHAAFDALANSKDGLKGVERTEAELLEAIVLLNRDLKVIGLERLIDIIEKHPGTEIQLAALQQFEKYAREAPYDIHRATSVFGSLRLPHINSDTNDMVQFHAMISNVKKNFFEFAKRAKSKIHEKGFWLLKYSYWKALDQYRAGQLDEAKSELDEIRTQLDKPSIFRWELDLNRARMLFEQAKYVESEKLYDELSAPGRRYGLTLLEKSWSIFHQRELERAAGILEALKSPYFNVSATPERQLLEMLIYREFCQFTYLKPVIARFKEYYAPIINQIRKGKPLNEIKELMSSILLGTDMLTRAHYIQELRREQIVAEELNLGHIAKQASQLEKFHRRKLEYEARHELRDIANRLLTANEQMKLIEYVAGISEIKNARKLASQGEISDSLSLKVKERDLAWPVDSEYWWEELPLFKVKIRDLCEERR